MNGYILRFLFLLAFIPLTLHSQKNIPISGKVIDDKGFEIPYAAIGIVSKNIGTTSTEDGTFYFQISAAELKDTLSFSSLGFSTHKLPLKTYKTKKSKLSLKKRQHH